MKQTLEALVNPFGDLKSESPDNVNKINFEKDELVDKLVKNYIQAGQLFGRSTIFLEKRQRENALSSKGLVEILTPSQINLLLQKLKALSPKKIADSDTGAFFSTLIEYSFRNNYNDFTLHFGEFEITNFGNTLSGLYDTHVKVNIYGSAGNYFAKWASYCDFIVHGNVGFACGERSSDCKYEIDGSAGTSFGIQATRCVFNLRGDADAVAGQEAEKSEFYIGGKCGHVLGEGSKKSKFHVKGDVGSDYSFNSQRSEYVFEGNVGEIRTHLGGNSMSPSKCAGTNCIFKTTNKQTYEKMKAQLPAGNQVILL